ncbi:MAG: type II 3-dehydroquinate dehydratase [Atopobiaceae bacterium]|nr:type II 3-dehydroquinate dehydratase [Atopobiaceae bacterium]MDO4403436.1 type II 3-dehydroquinate dehydratase [Atopobiaceae bacterium]
MSNDDIAAAVLECVGGFTNVAGNSLCATRLRVSVYNPTRVDRNALHSINGVLGIADRGPNGIEIVFGPNLVRGVYHSFERLTGLFSDLNIHGKAQGTRPHGNFQVTITPEIPGKPRVQVSVAGTTPEASGVTDDDTTALLEMLDDIPSSNPADDNDGVTAHEGPVLLVINGPNLNMLGIREPELYGKSDYTALLSLCHESALEAGFASCDCYQSNHEGDLVDRIQDAYGLVDAIVINPGAYTHTSVALLDALKAVQIPTVEVHISKVDDREEFRQVSYVRQACIKTITGMGIEGYRKAIFDLADYLAQVE